MSDPKLKLKAKAKRKRRKIPSLIKDSLRLETELSKYMLYEYTIQTTMAEVAFSLAEKRKGRDYIS
jgi:hypothetical protein